NGAAGFEVVSGAWNNATGVSGYYEQNYLTSPAGTGTSKVRWHPVVAATVVQRTRGSQWVSLGYFPFVAGSTPTVELSNNADGYVIADAVRLVYQGVV